MCDYEPCDVFTLIRRKARKQHKCTDCGSVIFVGEHYTLVDFLFDGEWEHAKTCSDCEWLRCQMNTGTSSYDCDVPYGRGVFIEHVENHVETKQLSAALSSYRADRKLRAKPQETPENVQPSQ